MNIIHTSIYSRSPVRPNFPPKLSTSLPEVKKVLSNSTPVIITKPIVLKESICVVQNLNFLIKLATNIALKLMQLA